MGVFDHHHPFITGRCLYISNQPDWDGAQGLTGWWEDVVNDVLIDESTGDIFVTGTYRYDLHAGPFSLAAQQHHDSGNTSDIFVARWSGNNWAWIATAGGPDNDWASSLAMTNDGSLYVAGAFRSNTSTFGTHQLSNSDTTPRTLTTSPTSEAFLARMNPSNGEWMWVSAPRAKKTLRLVCRYRAQRFRRSLCCRKLCKQFTGSWWQYPDVRMG